MDGKEELLMSATGCLPDVLCAQWYARTHTVNRICMEHVDGQSRGSLSWSDFRKLSNLSKDCQAPPAKGAEETADLHVERCWY